MSEKNVELSDDHVKEALAEVIKNEQFTEYEIFVTAASGKGDNYLGILKRVKVTGVKDNGEKGDLSVIIKIPLESVALREKFPIGNMYLREIHAYNKILPKLNEFEDCFNIPQKDKFKHVECYKASADEIKEYLILQDMKACGYEMSDRKNSLSLQQVRLALEALANLHALSFGYRYRHPEEYQELTKDLLHPLTITSNEEFTHSLEIMINKTVKVLDDEVCIERLKSFGVGLFDKMTYYLCPSTADPYNVICHGDCWVNNMLFKYEDSEPVDITFVDWQILRHTSPITDIALLIFTSTDENLRIHYHELIDFYYTSLKSRLNTMDLSIEDLYPETVYRHHLKTLMPFGLLMALMVIPLTMSEVEDTVDIESLIEKNKINDSNMTYTNVESANRYETRIRGVVGDFVRLNLI